MWYEQLSEEQRQGADFVSQTIKFQGGVALFAEQGTGKTIISLAVIETLLPDTILLVTPLTSIDVTWTPRLKQFGKYAIIKDWETFKQSNAKRRVLILHFQLFVKLSKKLQKFAWDLVLIDEAQALKGRNSAQSRAARRVRNAKRRIALSGTPVDKSPIDVWAQMRFVDHTVLGEAWSDFADVYCYKAGFMGKKWEFRRTMLERFLRTLKPYIFRLSVDTIQPKPIFHLVPVVLLGEQRRIYQDMERRGIINLDGTIIKSDLAITKKVRLEQITGGFIYGEDDEAIIVGHAKERKLNHILKRIEAPVVVSCKFLEEVETVMPILRRHFPRVRALTGKVKDDRTGKHRTNLIHDFQAGKIDALALQVRTGGLSIEFTRSHQVVIYSMNHSRIDFAQLISRLRRWGQKHQVEVWLLYAINTVDEDIRKIVEQKVEDSYEIESYFEEGATRWQRSRSRKRGPLPRPSSRSVVPPRRRTAVTSRR